MVRTVGVAAEAAPMVKGTVVVADCVDESVTEMPKEKLPLAVGMPEMTPVLDARARPAGSCPVAMLQV
jgi:hypothetical protein